MSAAGRSFEVGVHFESILRAISTQIYETPHAFIRENVQNAVDAVRLQAWRNGCDTGDERYWVKVTVADRIVSVHDNGIGMSEAELQNFFWTIGASGKRNEEAQAAGCVGMFGIGGFANFGVCEALEVTSQVEGASVGTRTTLSANDIGAAGATLPKVTVEPSHAAGPRGTVVIGHMNHPPNADELKTYLKNFVRFVPLSLTFNGERISQQRFADIEDRGNLTAVGEGLARWTLGGLVVRGSLFEDRGNTLVAAIAGLSRGGEEVGLTGQLRLENGAVDVFKRGFKLCATQIPSTVGVSGRLDSDLFVPTAGRDSLDATTTSLLAEIGRLLEDVAVDAIFQSPERIAQHTRIFRLIVRRELFLKMNKVVVRLADGDEMALEDVKRRATEGSVGVFFGVAQKHALNQIMQARGHIVVQLSSDRYRREAERRYLEMYCSGKPFDGMIDCTEVYDHLTRFERVFLSEVEQNISRSYEIIGFNLVAGRLTEDIPALVKERSGKKPIEIIIDVRHSEVTKLADLGLNPLMYSLISVFCREYIGPALKRWSPRFFGDGALNLERFAKRRSELWILVRDDISVVRKGGQRQIVTQKDVKVIRVGDEQSQATPAREQTHRLLRIVDDEGVTDLAGYYIRMPDAGFRAYGDLLAGCDSYGVVWIGNKITFVTSDGVRAQFQYEIRLDRIVAADTGGELRAEGALELDRPLQQVYDSVYFPIPVALEQFLVPLGNAEIPVDLHCEWIDMGSSKLWEVEEGDV